MRFVLTRDVAEFAAHADGLWLDVDPDVPGVSGPPEAVRAIAAAWTRRTAGKTRRSMEEAMHRGRGYASSAVAAASEWGR